MEKIFILITVLLFFTGCQRKHNHYKELSQNLAEYRESLDSLTDNFITYRYIHRIAKEGYEYNEIKYKVDDVYKNKFYLSSKSQELSLTPDSANENDSIKNLDDFFTQYNIREYPFKRFLSSFDYLSAREIVKTSEGVVWVKYSPSHGLIRFPEPMKQRDLWGGLEKIEDNWYYYNENE